MNTERSKKVLTLVDDVNALIKEAEALMKKAKKIESDYAGLDVGLYGLSPYFYDQDQVQPSDLLEESIDRLREAANSGQKHLISELKKDLAEEQPDE